MSAAVAERLGGYYPFSPEVIDGIAEFAERQASYPTYPEFLDAMGVGEPEPKTYDGYRPIQVVDVRPKEHDPDSALVMHLPMGNDLGPNQLYQVATIAGTNPDKRVIAVGNPCGPGSKSGLLTHTQRLAVASGDLTPVVDPVRKYLDEAGVSATEQYGYSYGAAKAATLIKIGNQAVDKAIFVEPVVGERTLLKLTTDFGSSNEVLQEYVEANGLPTFIDARKAVPFGMMRYIAGLGRLTNIAIARNLAKGNFGKDLRGALAAQPDMMATVAWGTASELATHDKVLEAIKDTGVEVMPLVDERHALANDVHLAAAIVREGLSAA